jgi:hypothetical protein
MLSGIFKIISEKKEKIISENAIKTAKKLADVKVAKRYIESIENVSK